VADRSAWRPAADAMGCEGDALTDAWQLCLTLVVNWSDCRYNGHWATGARVRKQRSLRPCLHPMRLTRLLSLLHLGGGLGCADTWCGEPGGLRG
jgi:hypothetical protein